MEIILAIVVASAVIFFGALISMGNERQRRAIDNLREQTVLWAMQDLRIKRERLARDVRVDDPLSWLNSLVTKLCGYDLNLQVKEAFDEPRALVCVTRDGTGKFVFSPLSPTEIRQMNRNRHSRLSQYGDRHPLLSLPRQFTAHEFSVLNSNIVFDLELPLAWQGLTHQETLQMEQLWMYNLT
ncbi:hypothetical protein ANAEL_04300 [Anaerolineales bacterium]|nr:hypothetical protein ANAEL_04300 [Anaerolineales bacterium]